MQVCCNGTSSVSRLSTGRACDELNLRSRNTKSRNTRTATYNDPNERENNLHVHEFKVQVFESEVLDISGAADSHKLQMMINKSCVNDKALMLYTWRSV